MSDQSTVTIAGKVAALLAKAESVAEQFPDEADAFNAKAVALMAKHSIDAAVVAAAQGVSEDGGIVKKVFPITGSYGVRKIHLAHAVKRSTGCQGVHIDCGPDRTGRRGYRWRMEIFGTVSDVAWCETLYDSLASQMDSQIGAETKRRGLSGGTGRQFGTAFVAGYTSAVNVRLKAVNEAAIQEADAAAKPGEPPVSLVLASKASRVEQEFRKACPNITFKKVADVNSYVGHSAGTAAGQKATISRGSVAPSGGRLAIG